MGMTLQILTKTNCCAIADGENIDSDDFERPQPVKSNPILTTDKNSKLINLESVDSFTTTIPSGSPRN